MNARPAFACLALTVLCTASAQGPSETLRPWPGDAPGARGQAAQDVPEITPWSIPFATTGR